MTDYLSLERYKPSVNSFLPSLGPPPISTAPITTPRAHGKVHCQCPLGWLSSMQQFRLLDGLAHHRDCSTHASHRMESAPLDPTRILPIQSPRPRRTHSHDAMAQAIPGLSSVTPDMTHPASVRHAVRPTSAWVCSTISESTPLAHR